MNILQIMGSATRNEAVVEIGAQHGQRHFAKAQRQQRLRIVECLVESGIHCLRCYRVWIGILAVRSVRARGLSIVDDRRRLP